MPSYLVETYLAHGYSGQREMCQRRARSAALQLTREGTPIRLERSIHIPDDEICFFVFDAPSSVDAARVAERAELDAIRVVEAVSSEEEEI
jgi:hypothetical protein